MSSSDSSRSISIEKKPKKDKKSHREGEKKSQSRSRQNIEQKDQYFRQKKKKKQKKQKHKSKKHKSISKSRQRSRDKKKKNKGKTAKDKKKKKYDDYEKQTQNRDKKKKSKSLEREREREREKEKEKEKEREKLREREIQLQLQREKQKDKQRQKQREKQKQREEQRERQREKQREIQRREKQSFNYIEQNKKLSIEEQRRKKFAMRQVKARLLKLNGLYGDDSDSDDDPPVNPHNNFGNIPLGTQQQPNSRVASQPVTTNVSRRGKRESKWGKTSSNQSSLIPIAHPETELQKKNDNQDDNKNSLSLDIEPSQDRLRLSEDKSMDVEDFHNSISKNQDEEDPLDEYMKQIEEEAIPQMQLPKKGQKRNIITFEDIVTSTSLHYNLEPQNTHNTSEMVQQSKQQQNFRKQFMSAVNNISEIKANQDKKGTMMQNNDQKQEQNLSQFEEEPEKQLDFFAKQRKMAERKQLHQVDHTKINYEDVCFNLYREADQIAQLDQKEIQKFRKQAGDIKIRGKNLLNPVFNWYQCGFNQSVINCIERNNYEKPFPIQAQSIPMILSGRDVIGIAETGSGKTFAYLLPLIKHVSVQRPVEDMQGPVGLIMTPTRELANQVYLQAKKFTKNTRIRVLAVYGGVPIQKQLSDFRKGAQIVICTPGRMIDVLTLNKGRITNLKRVTMVILDEADRMFDLGFQPQITRIIDNIRPNRQSILFSATFPKNVQNLARKILTNPVQILVGNRGQACRNVQQIIQVREQMSKFLRLLEILGHWNEKGGILIFIDKQNQADYLYTQLLKYGYDSLVLHGAMDPTDREFTIYDFKKQIKNIMIATSICARGLDIKEIVLVVNFKCPNHLEDYIHRIGRTGRAGNKGTAITFITPQEEHYSLDLIKALQMSEITPPEELLQLSKTYLQKVKKGQARKMRNRNIQGAGFKFDKQQQQKNSQLKDAIKKQLKSEGLGGFDDSDDDDIETKKKKEETMRGRNEQERVVEAIKNPEIKNKLLNEAVKAVSEAIKDGSAMTTQKLLEIAVKSMKQSVTKHKVITTVDDGIEQVTKLINTFQSKGDGQGIDFFSYDFEINHYPQNARQRACSKQFLNQIQRENNCSISLRGVYVEHGKKAPDGCRKLYLHIQAQDKSYVEIAYKDIKRVLQEGAYENMHMGGNMGKYTI